ncbi:MAG: ABC transporter ATP-binding protein [bacterium]
MMTEASSATAALEVRNLHTHFYTDEGTVRAVDGISFTLPEKRILGIVGESGCGKSVTALSILKLIPSPPGKIVDGEILFRGADILKMTPGEIRRIRGNRIAMIFQDTMTSLNPFLRISRQLTEPLQIHRGIPYRESLRRAVEMLELVEIPSAARRVHDYPHQFSGGMRQRAMIAMALMCEPEILIADEPTTALDVTIQAQILNLLKRVQEKTGAATILITHDLGIVAGTCDYVIVMYAGAIVEKAPVRELFEKPLHPYTLALLRSLPRLDQPPGKKLRAIEGLPPNLIEFPPGCRYNPRCGFVIPRCLREEPPLLNVGPGRLSACWVDVTTGVPR